MKKIAFITLSLLLAVSFWNCEKDDICAEGTPVTPRLVIHFFDATNTTTPKNITNLRINVTGFATIDENGKSNILIPLRTNADSSSFEFILNGADTDPLNDETITLTFNYERSDVYVSRACGYKTLFHLTSVTPTDFSGTWISNLEIEEPFIETENDTHVKIYF